MSGPTICGIYIWNHRRYCAVQKSHFGNLERYFSWMLGGLGVVCYLDFFLWIQKNTQLDSSYIKPKILNFKLFFENGGALFCKIMHNYARCKIPPSGEMHLQTIFIFVNVARMRENWYLLDLNFQPKNTLLRLSGKSFLYPALET